MGSAKQTIKTTTVTTKTWRGGSKRKGTATRKPKKASPKPTPHKGAKNKPKKTR